MSKRAMYNNFKIALLEKWHNRLVRCRVGTVSVCKTGSKEKLTVMCLQLVPCSLLAVEKPGLRVGTHVTPACRCSGLGQDGRETSGAGLALDLSGSEDRPSIQGVYPGWKGSSATVPAQPDPSHPSPLPRAHTNRLFDWLVSVINSSICATPDSWTTFIGRSGGLQAALAPVPSHSTSVG